MLGPMTRLALWLAVLGGCGRLGFGEHAGSDGAADAPGPDAECHVPAGLQSGLVGWWKLDETSGTIATDSAAGNDGLLLGGATHVTGHLGGAVQLDGVTGRVAVGGSVAYATHGAAFSFSAWVDLADWSVMEPDIMQIQTDGATSPFHVLLSDSSSWDGISTGDGDGSWIPLRTGAEPSTGVWHHVAVVYDGGGATELASFAFYLDAVAQPLAQASPYATQTNTTQIGAAEDPENYFAGAIDDVRIYDRALSAAEVAELYALTCD